MESTIGDAEFFGGLGFKVVDLEGRLVLMDPELGPVFLAWFDSPLGMELLDVRFLALSNVRAKTPSLLSFLDVQGSFTVGQWIFAGDETQGYNLTFGVQLPRCGLTAEVMSSTLDFLKTAHSVGSAAFEEIARKPDEFPNFSGTKFIRRMEARSAEDDNASPD